jgi:hypothetical protein
MEGDFAAPFVAAQLGQVARDIRDHAIRRGDQHYFRGQQAARKLVGGMTGSNRAYGRSRRWNCPRCYNTDIPSKIM